MCSRAVRRGCRGPGRFPAESQANQLANEVTEVVQQHQPDGHRNQDQIEFADPAQRGWFRLTLGHMHLADGEPRTSASMTLSASLGQILRVNGGLRVR